MVAAQAYPIQPPSGKDERRVLLSNVPWATYVVLRDTVQSSGVRMTYLGGQLELMSPSREHEVSKKQIARLLELFCLERDIPLYGYGSTTFRREEKEAGLEPDECYCRGEDREIPDIAVEVVVSAAGLDKPEVYRRLGVREVWLFRAGAFHLLTLDETGYRPIVASAIFPEVDLQRLAVHAREPDQHAALQAYRAALRS